MANMRRFSVWVTYLIGCLVLCTSALPQPVPGAQLESRQSSGLPSGESAYPIKAVLVSTNGNYVKFFFSTNNGKVYMGTWEKSSPSSYSFEEIAPASSARANSAIAAVMWDDSTTTGTEISWTNTNKQARVFFLDGSSIIKERVWRVSGSTNVWSDGTLGAKNVAATSGAGLSGYVYYRNSRFNIKLYYVNSSSNVAELSFGVSSYVWTGPGTVPSTSSTSSDAPLSFNLLTPYNTGSTTSFRNFLHSSGNVKDIKFDSTGGGWIAGTFSVAVSGLLLPSGTYVGPPFDSYVLGIDTLSPVTTVVYCSSLYDVYTVPYPAGGTATILYTSGQRMGNAQTVAAGAASNSVSTADAHIFTWGDSFQGYVDFIHYTGDVSVNNAIALNSAM